MVSSLAVTMALPSTSSSLCQPPRAMRALCNPLGLSQTKVILSLSKAKAMQVSASLKEKAVTGLTAAALTAMIVIPDVAEAAQPGLSPSLKNFLLSIGAGGVVLVALLGAVIGVANFDPVKRT